MTGTYSRRGLSQALKWMEKIAERDDEPLQPSDPRVRDMQMVCKSVMHDDFPDRQNTLNPRRIIWSPSLSSSSSP